MQNKSKLFVCLPSYNEADNIRNITKKVDRALKKLQKEYECIIINVDNRSEDGTNEIFNATNTKCKKVSLLDGNRGKGTNIINFMKYFKENGGDYAILLDADLKSFKKKWIYKMLIQLNKASDFVFPLYKRKRYEGNTTNHFVIPVLYAITGAKIRQPIGGDYAFNSKYVDLFLKQKIEAEIRLYGIDIFMVSLVLKYNLRYSQIHLGKKVHALSYNKMEKIFYDVAKSFKISFKNYMREDTTQKSKLKYNSISKKRWCNFKNKVVEENIYRFNKLNISIDEYEKIKKMWQDELISYISNIKQYDDEIISSMKNIFMCYVLSYWKRFDKSSSKECEENIWNFAKEINDSIIVRNEENEFDYK